MGDMVLLFDGKFLFVGQICGRLAFVAICLQESKSRQQPPSRAGASVYNMSMDFYTFKRQGRSFPFASLSSVNELKKVPLCQFLHFVSSGTNFLCSSTSTRHGSFDVDHECITSFVFDPSSGACVCVRARVCCNTYTELLRG